MTPFSATRIGLADNCRTSHNAAMKGEHMKPFDRAHVAFFLIVTIGLIVAVIAGGCATYKNPVLWSDVYLADGRGGYVQVGVRADGSGVVRPVMMPAPSGRTNDFPKIGGAK